MTLPTLPSFDYHFVLYGLRLVSNKPRPTQTQHAGAALPPDARANMPPDVTVHFVGDRSSRRAAEELVWRVVREHGSGDNALQVAVATTARGLAHRISLRTGADYTAATAWPDDAGQLSYVEVCWNTVQPLTGEHWHNLASWVFDSALGYLLHLRIPANLHGGAVAMDGKAVAFVGDKGMGKSTLTAALIAAGYAMLTDDHVALWPREGGFWVAPGAPRLRLWPASLPVLAGLHADAGDSEIEALSQVYTNMDKRVKHLRGAYGEQPGEFQPTAMPLGAIYLLQPRDPTRRVPEVAPVSQMSALHELLRRRYTTVSASQAHTKSELANLAQVVQQTRICTLHRPDGLETLPQVIAAIRADWAAAT